MAFVMALLLSKGLCSVARSEIVARDVGALDDTRVSRPIVGVLVREAQPRWRRSGSAAVGVAEGEVPGAEGQFPDLEVGDVSGQLSPRLVEVGEVGDERGVQPGDPRP
jgi:hypothetical protein